jgi:hypothetical protein
MNLLFIYVAAVIAAGAALLASFSPVEYPPVLLAATLLGAMLVVSLFKLRLPLGKGPSTISMAFAVDFVALLTVGADVAMIVAVVGVLVQCCLRVRRRQPWYRTAFSVATVAISVQAAGWTWAAFGGTAAEVGAATVLPLAAMAIVYFAVDAGLVAGAIALSSGASRAEDTQPFLAAAPGYVLAAAVAAAISVMLQQQAYTLVPLAAAPMVGCHLAYGAVFRRMAKRLRGAPAAASV